MLLSKRVKVVASSLALGISFLGTLASFVLLAIGFKTRQTVLASIGLFIGFGSTILFQIGYHLNEPGMKRFENYLRSLSFLSTPRKRLLFVPILCIPAVVLAAMLPFVDFLIALGAMSFGALIALLVAKKAGYL